MRKPAIFTVSVMAAALLAASGAQAWATSDAPTPVGCQSAVEITSLAFAPDPVTPGQSSTATLKARNCTSQPQRVNTYWFGQFTGPTAAHPAGCPVIDPLPRPATLDPWRSISLNTTYLVFSRCTATALKITVRVVGSDGTQLDSRDATLTIQQPA